MSASAAPPPTPTTHGNALHIGYRLHEFEITGVLGEGGFGIVYTAYDTQLQRTVAIKEYLPSSLAYRDRDGHIHVHSGAHGETFALGMHSFINEARLLAAFDHPGLIKVHRFGEALGTAFMVMPWCQGPTLKAWLQAHPDDADEAWLRALLPTLLDAVDTLHAKQVYHRDIAPDNILLTAPDRPVLLDFGAARKVIGDATQAMTVILKPGYAPLEQYADGGLMKQGPWTDVYALCAVLYRAVTGRTPPASVARVLNDECVPASTLAAGRYSPQLLAAIDEGLRLKPQDRPASISVLRMLMGLAGAGAPGATTAATAAPAAADETTVAYAPAPAPASPAPMRSPEAAPLPPPPKLSSPPAASPAAPAVTPPRAASTHPGSDAPTPSRRPVVVPGLIAIAVLVAVAAGWGWMHRQQAAAPMPTTPTATAPTPSPSTTPPTTAAPNDTPARPEASPASASATRSASTPTSRRSGLIISVDAPTAPAPAMPAPSRRVASPTPAPTPARGNKALGARCGDILQKASLEPLNSEESQYLQKECQ